MRRRFAAETWHPAPGFLPSWLQIGLRGAVVPVLFLLTGALSPLTVNASDELAAASRHMLHRTIRATVRQWNHRIERARKHGVDLAPVAVSLMMDAGDADGAHRVQLIAEGLNVAESGRANIPAIAAPAPDAPYTASPEGAGVPDVTESSSEPPTDPGHYRRPGSRHQSHPRCRPLPARSDGAGGMLRNVRQSCGSRLRRRRRSVFAGCSQPTQVSPFASSRAVPRPRRVRPANTSA